MSLNASELASLPGLHAAKRAILEFVKADSSVHAVLFYGKKGAGKSQLARFLARAWLSGCGANERAASSFDNGNNADFLLVQPMPPSRIIRDCQITEPKRLPNECKGVAVLTFLRTPPLTSDLKVVIIEDADRMNPMAANAILKTLEEPHPYAKFILTTTSVGSLPPTILSRCTAIACELPEVDSQEPLWLLADGSHGLYQELSADPENYMGLWELARTLRHQRLHSALRISEELRAIADQIQKKSDSNSRSANADVLELLAIALKKLHPDWATAQQAVVEAHRRIQGNGNAGLVFDRLLTELLL